MPYDYLDSKKIVRTLLKAGYVHHIVNINELLCQIRKDKEVNRKYFHRRSFFMARQKGIDYHLTFYRALASRINIIGKL